MTPAFGFSVGDFISAIGLVKKVSKALKETGGATTEYQLVVVELKGLKNILRHLETLKPTEDNVTHINAIRGMALACQLPLRDFMAKLEKYESTLGPFADKRSLRVMVRKSKWAVVFAEEVERLRAMVAAKNISLNLLLAMNTSQNISSMNSQNQERHSKLMSKAAEHRAALQKVQDGVVQVEDKVSRVGAALDYRLDRIENRVSQARETSSLHFDKIGASIVGTQTSIMSLRSTGEQILRCLGTFPREMRELLQSIVRANWQMYQVLLKIQQSTTRSPTGLLESNIRFEDALGDYRELPYEYFRHWEPFEGFLRAQFKDKLGERKVLEGQYHIIDVGNGRTIVKKEHWTRSIEQGATLTMSMVMSHLQTRAGFCPRPSCPGTGFKQCPVSGLLSCTKCNLKFYPTLNDLDHSASRLKDEDEVARRQKEEDLRLYGSRIEPVDAREVDDDAQLADSPTEDITTDFETGFNEAEKAHKHTESKSNDDEASIIDGNGEVNPLSAWLTQSALPSVVPMPSHPLDQGASTEVDLIKQERKEIETFRYVHVASGAEVDGPVTDVTDITKVEDMLDLELPSQIYYRNIVDRYPLLPIYLARRLAEANSSRAERLSSQRVEAMAKAKNKTVSAVSDKAPRTTKRPGGGPIYASPVYANPVYAKPVYASPGYASPVYDSYPVAQAKMEKAIREPKTTMRNHIARTGKQRANSYASLSKSQPQYDYWSGGSPRYRTKSAGSRSSSRNSSLHGSPKFCYQKQYQNVDYFASKPKYHYSSPSLPPPPVKLSKGSRSKRKAKKLSFDCDICGENVQVNRRREWQKHVMRDLRPYICTARECDNPTETFPSLVEYLNHERQAHKVDASEHSSNLSKRWENHKCIFCRERIGAGNYDNAELARGHHVGRHMEEIAFTVVSKAYEEWEFYSEASTAKSRSSERTKAVVPKENASATDADVRAIGKVGMPSRKATAKDAKNHGILAGHSLKHWDPEEEPILLLGSVFDANSLCKWIYDWTVFRDGPSTPMCDIAGELWRLMISLAGKKKRIEESIPRVMKSEDEELLLDFLAGAERLWIKFKKLLKACEEYMWKPVKKEPSQYVANHGPWRPAPCGLTQEQLATLEAEFAERSRPNNKYKQTLAEKMGLEFQVVNHWFQNRPAIAKYQNPQERRCDASPELETHRGGEVKMGTESGVAFVDAMFGPDRKLEATESLMKATRLWIMRFEANCEDILKTAKPRANGILRKK